MPEGSAGIVEKVKHAFTDHPHQTGETYLEHLWFTVRFSLRFVVIAVVLIIHGIFPFFFVRTASQQIERIYGIMKNRAPKKPHELAGTSPYDGSQ